MNRRTFLTGTAGGFTAALASRAGAQELPLGPLAGTRYPDPRIESLDPRFRKIGNAGIERIATGFRWCEGPVYVRDGGYLLWSDIPNNRILGWT
jgi:gluconolactonase